MKKRIITMALAVIMLLAVLTGCGDNASNPGNDTPPPRSSSSPLVPGPSAAPFIPLVPAGPM